LAERHRRQRADLFGRPGLDGIRHVQTAVRREAVEQRRAERGARRRAARRDEPDRRKVTADHGITCAPRDEMGDTYTCDSPPIAFATAAVIATATRSAVARSRHNANTDGPDPEMLDPSAPAS